MSRYPIKPRLDCRTIGCVDPSCPYGHPCEKCGLDLSGDCICGVNNADPDCLSDDEDEEVARFEDILDYWKDRSTLFTNR